jgi:hypothetical protein
MTQLEKINKGITILLKYGADHLEPDHDQILIYGAEKAEISEEDVKELNTAGFHKSAPYDNAWLKFT